MTDTLFVEGLPLKTKPKFWVMIISFILMTINHNLKHHFGIDYPGRDWVSLGLIGIIVIFSLGSYFTETLVIGVSIVVIISNAWDLFVVFDTSPLRIWIIKGVIALLMVELTFGKVGMANLLRSLKQQLGMK